MGNLTKEKNNGSTRGATPLMRQYYKIKDRHPDAVLLFRLGDFYETFEEDARTVSQVLGITLTKRANGKASEVPLAGFPHHALDNYLPKLVQAGLRVAVCEQLEDPKLARKIVKRDVVEIVTPGVTFRDQLLDPKRSTYLAAIHWGTKGKMNGRIGVAYIDASTGEFYLTEAAEANLDELLNTIDPSEVLVDKRQKEAIATLRKQNFLVTPQEDWCFGYDFAYESLLRHFKTHSLKGFGVEEYTLGLTAAGAALYYLGETQKGRLPHISKIQFFANNAYMALDSQTRRNLELIASIRSGRHEGTLVEILDRTQTPMGGRMIRRWLLRPLRDISKIRERLDAVEAFTRSDLLRNNVRDILSHIGDLERLAVKVSTGRATPRELISLKNTLRAIPDLKTNLEKDGIQAFKGIAGALTPCDKVVEIIEMGIIEDPPAQWTDGGFISKGYDDELDELRGIATSGKDWIARMQKEESEKTGIPSLKVGYNKVFGYYLEVTNAHKDKVPEHFIRKQTLVNAERYITPDLKEYEEKILTAQERISHIETSIFQRIREDIASHTPELQSNATLIAMIDSFTNLAEVAVQYKYVRPQVHEGTGIDIVEGRHPVVEKSLPPGEPFIANSIKTSPEERQILIITGPNMAGKSVVLRQTGLIVLLAQVGSFVPAERAEIGVVDRIFTRVGASDNLASGESTFLVEMNETANILNNASPSSLILLDEVGRGTSTFDGLSIAWALVEYLHEHATVAAQTLFATHYHELNELAGRYNRVVNLRVQVNEHNGKVVFLRKLVPGGADHSYGIEVARMAGLPAELILRAQEILLHLEGQQIGMQEMENMGDERVVPSRVVKLAMQDLPAAQQLSLFQLDDKGASEAASTLRELDPNTLTPVEALLKLVELKKMVSEE